MNVINRGIFLIIMLILGSFFVYAVDDLNSGLKEHWSFDDDTVSGSNTTGKLGYRDGVIINDVETGNTTAKLGQSFKFDGNADKVNVGQGFADTNGTVCMWLRPDTSAVNMRFFSSRAGSNHVQYYLNSAGTYVQDISVGGSIAATSASGYGDWDYYCAQWGSDGMAIYMNGVQNVSNSYFNTWTENTDMMVGCSYNYATTQCWAGVIDEVSWWNRTLTASEHECLYNEGTGLAYEDFSSCGLPTFTNPTINDSNVQVGEDVALGIDIEDSDGVSNYTFSWYNQTGITPPLLNDLTDYWSFDNGCAGNLINTSRNFTEVNSPICTYGGVINNGLYTYGSNNYLQLNSFPTTYNETFAFWINFSGAPNPTNLYALYTGGWGWAGTEHYGSYSEAGFTIPFKADDDTTGHSLVMGAQPKNTWTHVVIAWNETGATAYINGKWNASVDIGKLRKIYSTPRNFFWGTQDGDPAFLGMTDELAHWDRTLTLEDAVSLYNSSFGRAHPFADTEAGAWINDTPVQQYGWVLIDDFEDGIVDPSMWENYSTGSGGSINEENGYLNLTFAGGLTGNVQLKLAQNQTYAAGSTRYKWRVRSEGGIQQYKFIGPMKGAFTNQAGATFIPSLANGWRIFVIETGATDIAVQIDNDGGQLNSTPGLDWGTGVWNNISVRFEDEGISVWLDETRLFNQQDNTYDETDSLLPWMGEGNHVAQSLAHTMLVDAVYYWGPISPTSLTATTTKSMPSDYTVYNYTWYATDVNGNTAQSSYYNFSITPEDVAAPTFSGNITNNYAPVQNEPVEINITITDDTALSHYIFSQYNYTVIGSLDRTVYYYDGTYYITDGIEDSDITIDGGVASAGDLIATGGWTTVEPNANYDPHIYNNSQASLGTVSIFADGTTGLQYESEYVISNSSFTGTVGVKQLLTTTSQDSQIMIWNSSGSLIRLGLYGAGPNYGYGTTGTTHTDCDENTISATAFEWAKHKFIFNGTHVEGYVDDTLCHIFEWGSGIEKIQLFDHFGSDEDAYWDEFYVSNGVRLTQIKGWQNDTAVGAAVGLLTNLTSYYTFNDSDYSAPTLSDVHGSNDGTNNGATDGNTTAILGESFSFTSPVTGDYIDTGTQFDTADGTVCAWLYPTQATENHRWFSDRTGGGEYVQAYLTSSQTMVWHIKGSTEVTLTSNGVIPLHEWVFVCNLWGADGQKMYINGVLNQTDTNTDAWTANSNMWIGAASAFNEQAWEGNIDELGIWNRQLSDSEVSTLYNNDLGLTYPLPSTDPTEITVSLIKNMPSTVGWYNYTWFANDTSNNWGQSDLYAINVSSSDSAPTPPTAAVLNNTTPYTNDVINCSASGSVDAQSDPITYYYKFNESTGTSQDWSTTSEFDCSIAGCDKTDVITCWAYAFTDTFNSTIFQGQSMTVQNSAPGIVLSLPASGAHGNTNFTAIFTPTDDDSDTVDCSLIINSTQHDNNASVNLGVSTSLVSDITSDSNYLWRISCDDGTDITNTSDRTYIMDTEPPFVNLYYPLEDNTTISASATIIINATSQDPYLDMTNVSSYCENGSNIYTNETIWTVETLVNHNDVIDYSICGDGTHTLEVFARDSATDSPDKANYHARVRSEMPQQNGIEFYDADTGNNISLTFEIHNPAGNPISLVGKNVNMSFSEDGKHITFGGSADFNNVNQVGVFRYHSNNPDISLIQKTRFPGHFVTSDYELFFHHQALVDKGWTIDSATMEGDDFVVYFNQVATGTLDFDPISGGLNIYGVTAEFLVDTIFPGVEFDTPTTANGSYEQGHIYADLTVVEINLDTVTIFLYNASNLIDSQNIATYNFTGLLKGTYYLNATVNDTAGNSNSTETRIISLNNPPVISDISKDKTPYQDQDVTIYADVVDPDGVGISSVIIQFNGVNYTMSNVASNYSIIIGSENYSTREVMDYYIYADDSDLVQTISPLQSFTIQNYIPTQPENEIIQTAYPLLGGGELSNGSNFNITYTLSTDQDDTATQYISIDNSGYTFNGDSYTNSGVDTNWTGLTLADGDYWVVQWGSDGFVNGSSNNWTFTIEESVPKNPDNLTSSGVTDHNVTISWDFEQAVNWTRVYRNGSLIATLKHPIAVYNDYPVADGTDHYYVLNVVGELNRTNTTEILGKNVLVVTTSNDVSVPTILTGPTKINDSSYNIFINFTTSEDVYVTIDYSPTSTPIAWLYSDVNNSFNSIFRELLDNIPAGKDDYRYNITLTDFGGNIATYGEYLFTTPFRAGQEDGGPGARLSTLSTTPNDLIAVEDGAMTFSIIRGREQVNEFKVFNLQNKKTTVTIRQNIQKSDPETRNWMYFKNSPVSFELIDHVLEAPTEGGADFQYVQFYMQSDDDVEEGNYNMVIDIIDSNNRIKSIPIIVLVTDSLFSRTLFNIPTITGFNTLETTVETGTAPISLGALLWVLGIITIIALSLVIAFKSGALGGK